MPNHTILPDPNSLRLIYISAEADRLTLAATTRLPKAECPVCGKFSRRVHSRYTRTLADLPWQGIPVRVRLRVRRFFCEEPSCERAIFAERLHGVVSHYARRTNRLDEWFTHVSFALGGEAGARLLHELGVTVCGETLLKRIRSLHLGGGSTPRVLSVDDFSFRRGRRWGTVLVDLERHSLVDILPNRSADTFATWLRDHPGVEVVSRDRSGEYADAVRRAAPGSVQVADRFHLLKNLKDVILRVFKRHSEVLEHVPDPGQSLQPLPRLRLDREASRQRTRQQMRILFESIHALLQQGMNKSAIARTLGVHRHTVQKYSALDAPPRRKPYIRKRSALAPYEAYILKRWSDGCRNARQIWREIVEQGYPGAYRNVARITECLKKRERTGEPWPDAPPGLSPLQAAGMLVVRPGKRREEEQLVIEQLKRVHGSIGRSACLLEEFARMLREKEDDCAEKARERLESWMAGAEDSGIPELRAFVVKLRQDLEAVLAAIVLPYSQGQTEGQINKLKLIKRSMYGRGKFDLLRQRVLYAAN